MNLCGVFTNELFFDAIEDRFDFTYEQLGEVAKIDGREKTKF